jgi:hypothetical protein
MTTQFRNRRGEITHEALAIVNEQGFRGDPVAMPNPPGTFRIVCLGDSQTFGNGCGEGESWPAALQAELSARPAAQHIEVMNCGVGGYETEQEFDCLRKRWLAYDPDLVVLGFFVNDTALPGTAIKAADDNRKLIHFLAPGRPGFYPVLRRWSRLLDLGSDWLFRKLTMARWVDQRYALYDDDFAGWVKVRALMREARDLVESRHARFAILLVPLLMRHKDELISAQPYAVVSAFCRRENIPCFDPGSLFDHLDVDRMRVHPRDLHSNVDGNKIVGTSLAAWPREQELVPATMTR